MLLLEEMLKASLLIQQMLKCHSQVPYEIHQHSQSFNQLAQYWIFLCNFFERECKNTYCLQKLYKLDLLRMLGFNSALCVAE